MGIGKSSINGNEMELETEIGTEMGTNNAPFTDAMFCWGEGRAWERYYLFCAL